MEVLRYALVFLTLAVGGAILAALLWLLALPVLSRLRGTQAGNFSTGVLNGVAVALATVAAFHLCQLTGEPPSYAMYALPLTGMILNDNWRIRRAQTASSMPGGREGLRMEDELGLRERWVSSERINRVADVTGFVVGVAVLPPLPLL